MLKIGILDNPIRHYSWGSHTGIATLQRRLAPTSEPEAELWMGAHPAAPSRLERDGDWVSLIDVLQGAAVEALGSEVLSRFNRELPFLFKVLAASEPLSIQAHPDRAQAREGFERENRAGIALDAPDRNYRDPNPKPELICALTRFWALRGFRPASAIARNFRASKIAEFAAEIDELERAGDREGHRAFLAGIMKAGSERVARAVSQARSADPEISRWLAELTKRYPNDVCSLAPLFLNLVQLESGEAMYLGAGELHCYLDGLGVEIMGNSDNVLRCGLTEKHVDTTQLQRTLRFESGPPAILRPTARATGERVYPTEASEFELAVLTLEAGEVWSSGSARGPEIWLVTEGDAEFVDSTSRSAVRVAQGRAAFVPDCVESYDVSGAATLYRAGVPR